MKYEMLIYIGYIGGIFSILVNIYLFIKLKIKKIFMDLTGLTMQKEMKEINSKEKYSKKVFGYKKKHIKHNPNKNDTALIVKNLVEGKATGANTHDTQILNGDAKQESVLEETVILTEDLSVMEEGIQEDFVLRKNITIVHTRESITDSQTCFDTNNSYKSS